MVKINKDRILLERLDHLLTGHDDSKSAHLDIDTTTALETARRLTLLKVQPSKEFKSDLRARLIHQLAEQEKTNSRNQSFFFWELSRRKMWQGTIAALVFLVIAAVILLITFLNRP